MQAQSLRVESAYEVVDRSALRSSARAAKIALFAAETSLRLRLKGGELRQKERARELSFIADNLCALVGARPYVRGSLPNSPSLIVANHVSYLDPLLLASLIPVLPVAKSEVAEWPMLGEIAQRTGTLFYERGEPGNGARVLREMMTAFDSGCSSLVFPEGTTTRGYGVLPFKRGSFGAAQACGVPIVPVAILYERDDVAWVDDDPLLPHIARTCAHPVTHVKIRFLPEIWPDHDFLPDELAVLAREAIEDALWDMRSEDLRRRRTVAARVTSFA